MTERGNIPDPLQRRAVEIEVAAAFRAELIERRGVAEADVVFEAAVERLAEASAASLRDAMSVEAPRDLWEVWLVLGGDGRLDLELLELSDEVLRFRVRRCAYAEMYRERGLEDIGVVFSCRRDAPFARALLPGVHVEQSRTILEGNATCEFVYRVEAS